MFQVHNERSSHSARPVADGPNCRALSNRRRFRASIRCVNPSIGSGTTVSFEISSYDCGTRKSRLGSSPGNHTSNHRLIGRFQLTQNYLNSVLMPVAIFAGGCLQEANGKGTKVAATDVNF